MTNTRNWHLRAIPPDRAAIRKSKKNHLHTQIGNLVRFEQRFGLFKKIKEKT